MDILAVTTGQRIVAILMVLVCLLLILVILLQKGRGGGLAGAFGGTGGHSAFGAKTGDVFTWITVGLTFLFVLVAVIGNYQFRPPATVTPTTPVVQPENGAEVPAAAPTTQPQ